MPGTHEIAQLLEIFFRFAGEAHDERSANRNARNGLPRFLQHFQKRVAVAAALHAGQHVAAGVLQRHVDVFRQAGMRGNRIEQFRRDAVRVAVQEAHPIQIVNLRQALQQRGQSIADSQIFAVKSGVLADQRDFAHARGRQILGFTHHGLKSAAAEFSAQLWDHTKRAGMVAAFVDLDVSGVTRSGQNARGGIVVQIIGQGSGMRAVYRQIRAQLALARFQNLFHFASADHRVHFRNLLANIVAIALHHAAGDD